MKLEDVKNKASIQDNTIIVTLADDEVAFIERNDINVSKLFTLALHEIQQSEVETKLGNTEMQTPEEYISEVREKENNTKYRFIPRPRKTTFANGYKAWSDEEKQELIELYRKGTPLETIAVTLDRTIESIKAQIKWLRRQYMTVETAKEITKTHRKRGKQVPADNNNKPWTKQEEQQMLEMYDKGHSVKRISAILGRSPGSVTTRKWLATQNKPRYFK